MCARRGCRASPRSACRRARRSRSTPPTSSAGTSTAGDTRTSALASPQLSASQGPKKGPGWGATFSSFLWLTDWPCGPWWWWCHHHRSEMLVCGRYYTSNGYTSKSHLARAARAGGGGAAQTGRQAGRVLLPCPVAPHVERSLVCRHGDAAAASSYWSMSWRDRYYGHVQCSGLVLS